MRTKRTVLFILGLGLALACAPTPHPDRDAVLATVQGLFDAMLAGDGAAAAALFTPDARLIVFPRDGAGGSPNLVPAADFAANLTAAPGELLEEMFDPEVRIDGDMAMVWAPYDFHLGGEFSHCGVDLVDLARIDGQWLILSIAYTRQTEDCPDRAVARSPSY